MEFKLNKIDTDIRKKMQEEIKEDKVHSGKGVNVKKDLNNQKNEYGNKKQNSNREENRKRYITINVVKYKDKNIDVKVEKVEKINDENSKGRVLDVTK